MKTIKVYVAQKMNGLSHENICQNREQLLEDFKEFLNATRIEYDNVIAVNPVIQEEGHGRTYYLGQAISTMEHADFIIFARNWANVRGCKVEHTVCELYYKTMLDTDLFGSGSVYEIWWNPI